MNYIEYSEYLSENLKKSISYSDYLVKNIDMGISYTEYLSNSLFSKKHDRMKKINNIFNEKDKKPR